MTSTSNDVRVFISYRRSDCQAQANGLHDGLVHRLPGASIFKDIDSIPYGVDFEDHIRAEIHQCDVVLVLIGDDWLDARNATGTRRLDDADDFVRLEIETALSSPAVRVVPVLVEGATMPRQADLPPSIQRLARLRAIELSDARWRSDLTVLTSTLQQLARGRGSEAEDASDASGQQRAQTIGLDALDAVVISDAIADSPRRFQTKDVSEEQSVLAAHASASLARNYHTMVGRHLLRHQGALGIRSAGKSTNGRGEWWERLRAAGTDNFGPVGRPAPLQSDDETTASKTHSVARHRQPENKDLLDAIVKSTELDRGWVQTVVQDLRYVIDCLVADDYTVVLLSLIHI